MTERRVRRLGPPGNIEGLLRSAGYCRIAITVDAVTVRYRDPQQWWQASWHELPYMTWRHIPDRQREAAKQDAFGHLEAMREPDGSLTRRIQMGYAIAHNPAG